MTGTTDTSQDLNPELLTALDTLRAALQKSGTTAANCAAKQADYIATLTQVVKDEPTLAAAYFKDKHQITVNTDSDGEITGYGNAWFDMSSKDHGLKDFIKAQSKELCRR